MRNGAKVGMIPAVIGVIASAASYGQAVEITKADVNAMTYKVNMASSFFEATWRDIFARAGYKYPAPKLVGYVDSTKSGCGELKANNAHYCGADNTIYYDTLFLTRMMKATPAISSTAMATTHPSWCWRMRWAMGWLTCWA